MRTGTLFLKHNFFKVRDNYSRHHTKPKLYREPPLTGPITAYVMTPQTFVSDIFDSDVIICFVDKLEAGQIALNARQTQTVFLRYRAPRMLA